MEKKLLPFIENEELYGHVKKVLITVNSAVKYKEKTLYKNIVDPFSAIFDSLRQGITLEEWLEQEKTRQIQKTMQNALGEFHADIIGSIAGWDKLPAGNVVDVRNTEKRIIAEVKNKWNTTKGSDKKAIYDNLKSQLDKGAYSGFIGYYVEVIPSRKGGYDKPFTPPDNVTKTKRPVNENIRMIDGDSFYEIASGLPGAIKALYDVLPGIIIKILGNKKFKKSKTFYDLFDRAF